MRFDALATRLSANYALFLYALSGRYQQLRAPGVEIYPNAISDLFFDATQLAATFYSAAESEIDNYLRPMIEDATDDVADGLVVRKKEALSHIRAMTLENVQQVVKAARTGIAGVGDMLKGSAGAIGLLLQRKVGKIEFKTTDTSGRRWNADTLFRVVVRDFAYQAWLDFEADRYAQAGQDLMQTPKGRIFSLLETTGYDSFEAVRPEVFHINSNEVMVPHVPS